MSWMTDLILSIMALPSTLGLSMKKKRPMFSTTQSAMILPAWALVLGALGSVGAVSGRPITVLSKGLSNWMVSLAMLTQVSGSIAAAAALPLRAGVGMGTVASGPAEK